MSVLVTCIFFTMDDDSAAFTKEWESVSTPSREVTILAASILIVTAIPSAGPFPCLDEKKLQRTFKLYLVSNSNKTIFEFRAASRPYRDDFGVTLE